MSDPAVESSQTSSSATLQQPKRNPHVSATLRFRTRVLKDNSIPVGPGKIELLKAVNECRSISAAAKSLGMSYRRAWLLIDEMNRTLKEPVITTVTGGSRGGGSLLTVFGEELIELYTTIELKAYEACKADIQRMLLMVRQDLLPAQM